MNIFKEIWKLGKLLFHSRPKLTDSVELMEMTHFPFPGYKYMMWCGKIIYRSENRSRILSEINTPRYNRDITHETIHLLQAKRFKFWIGFYLSYSWQWIKGNPITRPNKSAYYTIPYEVEAYAKEVEPNYIVNYNSYNLINKYTLKHRKSIYKKHQEDWKTYIRSL